MIKSANPRLLNVTYVKPTKSNNNEEYFDVIYQTEGGEVCRSKEPPNADIWFVKPEYRTYTYNKPEERMEKMNKVTVPISKIRYRIAQEIGEEGTKLIRSCYENKDFRPLNQLYKWPYCYACDFQPEYYFMKNWYDKYKIGNVKLSKAFIDIETDLMDYTLDMENIPNTAYSPVNLITVALEETNESWTFILRPYEPSRMGRSDEEYRERYKLYEKQMQDHIYLMNHLGEFIKDLNDSFDPTYGHTTYHLREYEREIDLIADAFRLLNTRKPNFCLIWNMRFDIQYLYHRIIALGYSPESIMCHPDFDQPKCYFKVDKSTFLLEKQYDYFYCSSYTQYICQMRLYASVRKSQHKLKSVALNDIGDRELKDRKVEYPEEANIVRFPYVDWMRFIKYNIKDTRLQVGIERKTNDVLTYYMKSHANLTPYAKIFRETHLLRNVREMYFNEQGWVQGNNLNILDRDEDMLEKSFYRNDDEDDEEATFKGAINADPVWNAKVGMRLMGMKTNNIFQNPMDYDMGAFYPSIKIASNMDPITLLFKAAFNNDDFISGEYFNRSLNQAYVERDKNGNLRKLDITGEAVNTYVSGNVLTFGYNYLGFPSVSQIMERITKSR